MMHPSVRNRIESYTFTLYPSTIELVASWLDNGSDLNEIDYTRAQWAASEYKRLRYMDAQWEPQRFTMTLNMAGVLLDEVYARIEALDTMLHSTTMGDPEVPRMMREHERLLEDKRELSRVHA